MDDTDGTAADWWSLGILIHQCLTLTTPFEGSSARETVENIIHGRRVQQASPWVRQRMAKVSDGAKSILDALLHPDPAERLGGPLRGSEHVRLHPFFWGFEWAQIEKRQMTPPHAARCRERAVAATQHPSLRLPPLPMLAQSSARPSARHPHHLGNRLAAASAEHAVPSLLGGAAVAPRASDAMTTMQIDMMEGAHWQQEQTDLRGIV